MGAARLLVHAERLTTAEPALTNAGFPVLVIALFGAKIQAMHPDVCTMPDFVGKVSHSVTKRPPRKSPGLDLAPARQPLTPRLATGLSPTSYQTALAALWPRRPHTGHVDLPVPDEHRQ
jgi:hypothetical protein